MQVSTIQNGAQPTLYAAVDGRMASLGADEAVFFELATGRSHVMTRDVAQAFGMCQTFLPMDAHVMRVMEAMPALKGQGAAVQKVLEMFLARGLMQTDAQFLSAFSSNHASNQASISGVFLCAGSRNADVRAALDGLAEHAGRFGLAWPLYLIDIASDAVTSKENAECLKAFALKTRVPVHHFTKDQVRGLVDEVSATLPHAASVLSWLLTAEGQGKGAARNLVTLLGAGSRYVVLNAETTLPLLSHPEVVSGVYADSRAYAARTFDSKETALAAGKSQDTDVLVQHLAAVGAPLATALAGISSASFTASSLYGIAPSRLPWFKPNVSVVSTQVGSVGKFALTDPALPFGLSPAERAGLVASRETYLATYREPVLWQGTRSYQVGVGNDLMPLAMDGSQLLPCTLPNAHKADALFMELVHLMNPRSVDLSFPQALVRTSAGTKSDDEVGRPDSAECLRGLVSAVAQDLYASESGPRLGVIAARLEDMAAASNDTLVKYLSEYLAYYRSSLVERMQRAAASEKSPPVYWLADLRAAVQAQGKALVAETSPRLAGWSMGADAASMFRHELTQLAAGLSVWPELIAQAQSRNAVWRDSAKL